MSVSIIIPAYNAEQFLGAAIDSALAQSLPAAQVIVVDDGSTDGTAAVAERYGDAVWCLRQANAGVAAARNRAAREASADWLLFLDADDLLLPRALGKLAARSKEGDFGVVYGQTTYFWEGSERRRVHGKGVAEGPIPAATLANFWKSAIATPGAAIIRRGLFDQAGGFRAEFNTAADRDLWMRAGMLAEFGFIEEPVIEKREHGANMSGDKSRARRQAAEVQFSFLQWCDARGLPKPAIEEREIIERNLERALDERSMAAAEWLCAEARGRRIESSVVTRARRLLRMPAFAREIELRARALFGK
jgi:glycosyltransferase involved in cell wall biosynthesis